MNKNDLISIIVPIYNIENYVEKCIESILKQDYTNLEVILVDDGSTDSSVGICDKYKDFDSRIKVIHKENGGLSDARNAGIEVAKGKFLVFIDGDDYILDNFISKLYENILLYDADISVCGFSYKYEDGTIRKYSINEKEEIKILTPQEAMGYMLDSNYSFKQCAWNKMYKRELFNDVKYPYGMLYEDLGTTYKLIAKSNKIVYDSSSLYLYVQRNTSITKTYKYNNREKNRLLMVNEMADFLNQNFKNLKRRVGYFRATQYLAVINVMYMAKEQDKEYIREAKKVVSDNIFNVFKYGNLKQKMQFLIFILNVDLYKKILLGGRNE